MSAVPVSQNIRPSHDGQKPIDTPASLNRVSKIDTDTPAPTQPWNGASPKITFSYKKPLGKVIDSVIQFDLNIRSSDDGGYLTLSPTTLWADRRENTYAGNVLESQDADQIHMATLAFLTDQEFSTLAEAVNVGSDGNFNTAPLHITGTATKRTFWLPVWSGLFHSAQPFVRGFKDDWKLTLTMAKEGIVNSYKTTSGGATDADLSALTIQLDNISLWATEAQMSDTAISNLERAHKRQIVYRCITQTKFSQNETSIGSNSEYSRTLTSLTAATAGVVAYVKPSASDVSEQLTKYNLKTVGLLDAGNREIVQRLPDGLLRYFIQPESVPLTSNITAEEVQSYYVMPFCANLLEVIETGRTNGGVKFTGNEKLVFRPAAELSDVIVNVVAIEYSHVVVVNGVPTLVKSAY